MKTITELTFNLLAHQERASVQTLLDDEVEQPDRVSRKTWIRSWISRRKSEAAFFTIFQELAKKDSVVLEGLYGY